MNTPKISIEQWLTLQAVVDEGSFAKASKKLHKSQSTISYSIQQLQARLGLELLQIKGRKAVLTDIGAQLLNRSRRLTRIASEIESSVSAIQQGYEEVLSLMIDGIFPRALLFNCLLKFNDLQLPTVLHLREGILSGTTQAIIDNDCQLAITTKTPEGFIGIKLTEVKSLPYAHEDSPLHQLGRPLTMDDLHNERYIVVMDSGTKSKRNEGWLGSENQWKVDSMYLKSSLMAQGMGFSWLPEHIVTYYHLPLKQLLFKEDVSRSYPTYLVYRDEKQLGPACKTLIDIFTSQSMNK